MKKCINRYTKMAFRLAVKAVGAAFGMIVCGLLLLIGSRKGYKDLEELIQIFNGISDAIVTMIVRIPTALIYLLAYICAFIDEFIIAPIAKLVNLVLFPIRYILVKRIATDDMKNINDELARVQIGNVKNKIKSILSRVIYAITSWNAEVMHELLDEKERAKAENAESRKKNGNGCIDAAKRVTVRTNEMVVKIGNKETVDKEALNPLKLDNSKEFALLSSRKKKKRRSKKWRKKK